MNELKGCGSDALGAVMGAANDALGYILAFPRFGTDCFVWAVTFVRDLPALGKNVFNGNQKTLDELTSLCEWQRVRTSEPTHALVRARFLLISSASGRRVPRLASVTGLFHLRTPRSQA